MTRESARRVVFAVINDLDDRSGIGDILDQIRDDEDTYDAMIDALIDVVMVAAAMPGR